MPLGHDHYHLWCGSAYCLCITMPSKRMGVPKWKQYGKAWKKCLTIEHNVLKRKLCGFPPVATKRQFSRPHRSIFPDSLCRSHREAHPFLLLILAHLGWVPFSISKKCNSGNDLRNVFKVRENISPHYCWSLGLLWRG